MMFFDTLPIIIALLTWNDISALESWNGWGPNDNNDRYRREPLPVSIATIKTEFKQLWYTKLNGPAVMSPTVYENYVYVATFGGMFYSLQADNGIISWQKNLSEIVNNGRGYYSQSTPLVYNDMIIIGVTDNNILRRAPGEGSYFIAFNRFTGVLLWQTKVSSHPTSKITNAPQLANNKVFIGTSSREEGFAINATYACCSFQGSVIALEASTGTFLWETKMVPDNNGSTAGYSGAAVWASQFPVDYQRNQIYVSTGNYYKLPDSIQKCLTATSNLTLYSDPCNEPDAYGQGILALDMSTGIVRWSRNLAPINAWTSACVVPPFPNPNCPPSPGDDSDFAQAPILKLNLPHKLGDETRDQLFVGQKNGIAYGLDAETGRIIWTNQVSPGATNGGIEFGSAADDQHLYVGNNNGNQLSYTLPDGSTTTKASWSALDLVTGDLKWTTVDPTTNVSQTSAYLALTVWDQLVLVQGGSPPRGLNIPIKGCLYGLNKINGQVLYEKCIENTPIGSGASVARNTIYVTIGYEATREPTDGVMALQLPGYLENDAGTTSASSRKILLFLCLFYLFLLF